MAEPTAGEGIKDALSPIPASNGPVVVRVLPAGTPLCYLAKGPKGEQIPTVERTRQDLYFHIREGYLEPARLEDLE